MSDILPSSDRLRYKILNANHKNENKSYFNNKFNKQNSSKTHAPSKSK